MSTDTTSLAVTVSGSDNANGLSIDPDTWIVGSFRPCHKTNMKTAIKCPATPELHFQQAMDTGPLLHRDANLGPTIGYSVPLNGWRRPADSLLQPSLDL